MKKIYYIIFVLIFAVSYGQDQNDLALLQLGQQYERSGEIAQAEKIFAKLYEKNSHYFEFHDSYRRVLEYSKKYEEANRVISKWLSSNPSDPNQLTYLGINYLRMGKESDGYSYIQQAVKIAPKNVNIYRSIAAMLIEARYYDLALKIYLQARDIDPNVFIIETANIYVFRERYEEAVTEYLKLLAADKNQFSYIQSVMMSHIDNKKFLESALKITKEKSGEFKDNISFYYLLSWLYNEQKNYPEAFNVYLSIEKIKGSNGYELYNFAESAYRDKSYEIAASAFKYIVDNFPKSGIYYAARFGYAKTMEELSYEQVRNKRNTFSPGKDFSRSEIEQFYSGVLSLYEALLKEFPNAQYSAEIQFRIGEIRTNGINDNEGAKSAFSNLIRGFYNQPYAVNAMLELAEIYFMEGRIEEAEVKYAEVSRHPMAQPDQKDLANFRNIEFLYFSAKFDTAAKALTMISKNSASDFTNDALLLLNFVQNNSQNKLLPDYAKAEMFERQKKYSEALSLYKNCTSESEGNSLAEDAYFKIAGVYQKMYAFDDALKSYNSILNKFPESPIIDKTLFFAADICEKKLKDSSKAIVFFERILIEYPNSMYVNEARRRLRELKGEGAI